MAIEVTDLTPAEGAETILTPEALAFIEELHQRFASTRNDLLAARTARREEVSGGKSLDFLPETASVQIGRAHV